MNEGEGSADRSVEEEHRSLGWSGAFLAPCEEGRMTCFPFEVLSMWGRVMPSWPGWKDAWEESVWPRRSVAWQTVIASDKQSSLREERKTYWFSRLQLPAMTLGCQPCPAHPHSVTAIMRNTETLIWSGGFLIHHPVVFLEVLQGETQLKWAKKSTTSIPEVSPVQWGVQGGSRRVENMLWSQPILLLEGWKVSWHPLKPNDT